MYTRSKEVEKLMDEFNELTPWDKVEFIKKIATEQPELFESQDLKDTCLAVEVEVPAEFTIDDVFNEFDEGELLAYMWDEEIVEYVLHGHYYDNILFDIIRGIEGPRVLEATKICLKKLIKDYPNLLSELVNLDK